MKAAKKRTIVLVVEDPRIAAVLARRGYQVLVAPADPWASDKLLDASLLHVADDKALVVVARDVSFYDQWRTTHGRRLTILAPCKRESVEVSVNKIEKWLVEREPIGQEGETKPWLHLCTCSDRKRGRRLARFWRRGRSPVY